MDVAAVVNAFLVLVITGLSWLMPSLTKPTLPFGVRVPPEHAAAPVIAAQRRRYRVLVAVTGAAATAAAMTLATTHTAAATSGYLVLAVLAVFWLYYYLAHRAIGGRKRVERWYHDRQQVVVADTRLRTDPPAFPWAWALPAIGVLAATAATGIGQSPAATLAPVTNQLATTALIVFLCLAGFRARADLDAERPEDSAREHRRTLVALVRAVLVLSACVNLSLGLAAVLVWNRVDTPGLTAAVAVVPMLAGVLVVAVVAVRVGLAGRVTTTTAAQRTATVTRDDDRYWRAGALYVNRGDPSLLVPKRFGIGWTLNFGNPRAWLLLAAIVALPAAVTAVTALSR